MLNVQIAIWTFLDIYTFKYYVYGYIYLLPLLSLKKKKGTLHFEIPRVAGKIKLVRVPQEFNKIGYYGREVPFIIASWGEFY